jgi:hypothetical protein
MPEQRTIPWIEDTTAEIWGIDFTAGTPALPLPRGEK